jgi:hypothetical protein
MLDFHAHATGIHWYLDLKSTKLHPIVSSLFVPFRHHNRTSPALLSPVPLHHRATPSSALKQSSKFFPCLFDAWSPSILRFVVLWNDWKQVLHLIVRAAAF